MKFEQMARATERALGHPCVSSYIKLTHIHTDTNTCKCTHRNTQENLLPKYTALAVLDASAKVSTQ